MHSPIPARSRISAICPTCSPEARERRPRPGRLRGLFPRTASRLTEMQSEEYLAREHRP